VGDVYREAGVAIAEDGDGRSGDVGLGRGGRGGDGGDWNWREGLGCFGAEGKAGGGDGEEDCEHDQVDPAAAGFATVGRALVRVAEAKKGAIFRDGFVEWEVVPEVVARADPGLFGCVGDAAFDPAIANGAVGNIEPVAAVAAIEAEGDR